MYIACFRGMGNLKLRSMGIATRCHIAGSKGFSLLSRDGGSPALQCATDRRQACAETEYLGLREQNE